jgi:hypothetical protein
VYGRKNYNDFNHFYFQAASGTKGGSSGSPVIDAHGRAVALNAGGKNKAASAYYLPLERIVRVLRLIQAAVPEDAPAGTPWPAVRVPRGDLQTTFLYKGFDEVRRLGLRPETEKEVRGAPAVTHGSGTASTVGMLVVDFVLPSGAKAEAVGAPPGAPPAASRSAHGVLEAGDVLVKVNGAVVTHFLPLEEALDSAVGGAVRLTLERGGRQIEAAIQVTDLHSVTPACFLEFCGGSLHALSYQQARNNCTPVGQARRSRSLPFRPSLFLAARSLALRLASALLLSSFLARPAPWPAPPTNNPEPHKNPPETSQKSNNQKQTGVRGGSRVRPLPRAGAQARHHHHRRRRAGADAGGLCGRAAAAAARRARARRLLHVCGAPAHQDRHPPRRPAVVRPAQAVDAGA